MDLGSKSKIYQGTWFLGTNNSNPKLEMLAQVTNQQTTGGTLLGEGANPRKTTAVQGINIYWIKQIVSLLLAFSSALISGSQRIPWKIQSGFILNLHPCHHNPALQSNTLFPCSTRECSLTEKWKAVRVWHLPNFICSVFLNTDRISGDYNILTSTHSVIIYVCYTHLCFYWIH